MRLSSASVATSFTLQCNIPLTREDELGRRSAVSLFLRTKKTRTLPKYCPFVCSENVELLS